MRRRIIFTGVLVSLLVASTAVYAVSRSCTSTDAFCFQESANTTPSLIRKVTKPNIAVPRWLDKTTAQGNESSQ